MTNTVKVSLSPSTQDFLVWLKTRQPMIYSKMLKKLPGAMQRQGLNGLGDTSSTDWLSSITSAINSVTSTVTSVASDKALVSYNLERAKQGLAPVDSLPPNYVPPAPTGVTGFLSLISWPVLAAVGGGALLLMVLLKGGSKK